MMGFDGPAQIHLDVDQFASDAETLPIAKIVAAHAERRRAEYRLTEKKIKLGLLGSEGYWSDSVPWYEWMTEPQVLQPCAEECGLKIEELAAVIAYQIVPMNWQVYSWMSVALQGRNYQEMLEGSLSRHAAINSKMIKVASERGKNAADALHNKPGGTREKQNAIRNLWASGKFSSREVCAVQECDELNMSYSAARRALRNTPNPT